MKVGWMARLKHYVYNTYATAKVNMRRCVIFLYVVGRVHALRCFFGKAWFSWLFGCCNKHVHGAAAWCEFAMERAKNGFYYSSSSTLIAGLIYSFSI